MGCGTYGALESSLHRGLGTSTPLEWWEREVEGSGVGIFLLMIRSGGKCAGESPD